MAVHFHLFAHTVSGQPRASAQDDIGSPGASPKFAEIADELTVRERFPDNIYVQRLLDYLQRLNVRLDVSTEPEQWLYVPRERSLWVWMPDLHTQPLTYIVVILAHEIGHVLDFDANPHYKAIIEDLHWSEVPDHLERTAFVRGFHVLQQLHIPITLPQYVSLIEQPMADAVLRELQAA